jgi:hypothetical protein
MLKPLIGALSDTAVFGNSLLIRKFTSFVMINLHLLIRKFLVTRVRLWKTLNSLHEAPRQNMIDQDISSLSPSESVSRWS